MRDALDWVIPYCPPVTVKTLEEKMIPPPIEDWEDTVKYE